MAKQSVSFVERHLEKIVAGVAGLITLTVAVLFVVQSPSGVELSARTVGPGEIGSLLKEEARRVYQSGILGAKAPKVALPDYVADVERSRPLQIDRALAPRLAVAMTPLNPAPPAVKRIDITGKARLARILAPGKPVVFQGRNRATSVPPTVLSGVPDLLGARGGGELSAPSDPSATRDVTWVTVAAPVFRGKQLDEFNAAGYVPGRTRIVMTRLRLERQLQLPDGSWSEPPEAVEPYAKYLPFSAPEVRLIEDETGVNLDSESSKRLEALYGALNKPEAQDAIWRAPLAPYLDLAEWPPAGAPSIEAITWEDWEGTDAPGSQFKGQPLASAVAPTPRARPTRPEPTKTERPVRRPTRASGEMEPGGPSPRESAKPPPQPSKTSEGADERAKVITAATKSLSDARAAFDAGNLEMAMRHADEVIRAEGKVPQRMVNEADSIRQKAEEKLRAEETKLAKKKEEREARAQGTLEADVEPVWTHDLSAEPGRTYRYRVRFELFNVYSLFPRDLTDPRDVQKTILASDWSEWSEPVTVRPDTLFFLTQANPNEGMGGTATVNLYKWVGGEWQSVPRKKFEVGQPIACEDRKAGRIDAQVTVVEVAADAKRAVRLKSRRDGSFDIKPDEPVQVVLVAGPNGQIWEHNNLDDRIAEAELRDAQKEAQNRESASERRSRAPLAAPAAPMEAERGIIEEAVPGR